MDQEFAGSEDVEISRKHNLAVATIGLRYHEWFKDSKLNFQGIFIYHLEDLENPVKIAIPKSNPHGLSLFELENGNLRIFIVSHDNGVGNGVEETIIIDYFPGRKDHEIVSSRDELSTRHNRYSTSTGVNFLSFIFKYRTGVTQACIIRVHRRTRVFDTCIQVQVKIQVKIAQKFKMLTYNSDIIYQTQFLARNSYH